NGASGFFFTSSGSFSDARLKKDVQPTKVDALAALMGTPIHEFKWNEEGMKLSPYKEEFVPIGFIAQEVQETMPIAVNAHDLAGGMLHLLDDNMTAYIVRAIQQLAERIEKLEPKSEPKPEPKPETPARATQASERHPATRGRRS